MNPIKTNPIPSLFEASELLKSGELTSRQLTEQCFANIHSADEQIGAFLHLDEAGALAQADASDERRKSGKSVGRMDGIPVGVKDLILTEGAPTTAASKILENYIPPYDAHCVYNLKASGAVIVGKCNLDEFAMGSSNEHSAYKKCLNPLDATRTPGGSSGGSAAAVVANMCPGSLGTETGGSVRQPASYCGLVGVKPSYGRVSRRGVIAFASSLDQVAPFAKDVKGAALLLESIAGNDPGDSTSAMVDVPNYLDGIDDSVSGMKIGVAPEFFAEGLEPEIAGNVRASIQTLKAEGMTEQEIHLPHLKYSVALYYVVATAEAASNLSRYDGVRYGPRLGEEKGLSTMYNQTRGELFGSEVKRRILLGTYVLSSGYYDAYYLKAQKVRAKMSDDFYKAFEQVDVIIGPTTPTTAFKLGEKIDDPIKMYLNDMFTIGANMAGLCAISVPSGTSAEGLPLATQIIAKPFAEAKMFQVARALEKATASQI